MAATTLATSMSLIKDKVLAELIMEYFVRPDPVASRCPMQNPAPFGYRWRQEFISQSTAASAMGFWDTMAAQAFQVSDYQAFLNVIYRADDRNAILSQSGEGQQGRSDQRTKKKVIIRELSQLFREYLITGEPSYDNSTSYGTGAIGATLQALLGASATIEAGPRLHDFDDVHQKAGGTTSSLGCFKWTNNSAALQYKAPFDSYYGPAQTISAANYYRVKLFSGIDSSNNPNRSKWVTVTLSPVATILAAANYESDTTAAKGVTFYPTKRPTGWLRQVSPEQEIYPDLDGSLAENGTTACGNGPNGGMSINRECLTWMKQKLLDASNDNPSNCAILMTDNLMNASEGVIPSLGAGINPVAFMDTQLNTLSYGSIPIIRNNFLPTNITSRDGSRSDLTCALGIVLGTDAAHCKYIGLGSDTSMQEVSALMSGAVAVGDGTPSGTQIPLTYYEGKNSILDQLVYQIGTMVFEPVATLQSLCKVTHLING